ncbi:MAG: 4-phosphoerythronate dehydrogenase [Candidatus Kapabacteria bacterium]|nr:4-phosphoerythronate dehydrogenase [Candidatus Kapabacteria bacterium]
MIILVDENIDLLSEVLSKNFDIVEFYGRDITNEIVTKSNAEAIFVRSTCKVNEKLLNGSKIKFVATATAGVDHIDQNYLKKQGIYFTNADGGNANSVAEYVIFSILHWSLISNIDLKNKSIGIVGFGNIGKLIGKYSKALGLNIYINDLPLHQIGTKFPAYTSYLSLNEITKQCDIVTNHVPLEFGTLHPTVNLFNYENMLNFKPNSLLIHTSRGGVINEFALNEIHNNQKLSLAIDVWEDEPNFHDEIASNAMIATPHIAGYSYDGKINGAKIVASKFCEFYKKEIDFILFDTVLNEKKANINDYISNESLYKAIQDNRFFLEDINVFKNYIGLSKEEKINWFNLIRKTYPIRRELF